VKAGEGNRASSRLPPSSYSAAARNRKLSQQVCKLLNDSLGVPEDRVYLNFTDVEASNWGWNGSTFG
jgi:phenylpyruvate tautomerase PptA (4-oxalocrotonate tautomerase family)